MGAQTDGDMTQQHMRILQIVVAEELTAEFVSALAEWLSEAVSCSLGLCCLQALRPGGLLLIRDHGLYDLTHLRLPHEQQLAKNLYRRLDGTTCYFFTTEDLQAKAEAAGFVTKDCKYACTNLLNRKKQINMKRVFVHGVFEKHVV